MLQENHHETLVDSKLKILYEIRKPDAILAHQ
jgi:hypothetical protein